MKRKQTQREMVYNCLKHNSYAYEISKITELPIATVHKRLNDLYNDGLVCQTGYSIFDKESNQVYAIYRKTSEDERLQVKIKRNIQRNIDNLNVRLNNGWITQDRFNQDLKEINQNNKLENN